MISYNPKDWFTFIFRFHKADTFRKLLPVMVGIAGYSWLVAWLEIEYWKLSDRSHVKNITVVHSLMGFVISMLLVFRTNTAYDRWWEGRKLWGALVNNSRNLAVKLSVMLSADDRDNREFFMHGIPAFAHALKHHLRGERMDRDASSEGEFFLSKLDFSKHIPNQVCLALAKRVQELVSQDKLSPTQWLVLNPEVSSFADICGACERIKNTPIPFSYNTFVKKFIFFYVMSLPFGYVFSLGYFVIPVVVFIFYVLASLELIAEEIEEPFGGDANDLPTDQIATNIQKHVREVFVSQ